MHRLLRTFHSRPKDAVREPEPGWDPDTWATRIPLTHLENFGEVFRAGWENRDRLGYAWRILDNGVCDGCALGTTGLEDWTIDGIHLCNVRLRLLRLNTLPAADPALFADAERLASMPSRELRELGRLPHPMIRRAGDAGFAPISWDAALDLAAERIAATEPDARYLYLTSRGIPNETYYQAQKAWRALGSNQLDNAARICHSPSTVGLKAGLGVGATTCSYTDLIGSDLITFIGSNVAKNQPVVMKYLYHAKKAGSQVVVVNPYEEPGMDAYWVPSDLESALFGTKIADEFVQVAAGGDRWFLRGAVKALIEMGAVDHDFVDAHTEGFDELRDRLERTDWGVFEGGSGLSRDAIRAYAARVARAETAVFVWGMGITQHAGGESNVRAIIDLALTKGFVGRDGCGLMPIRGHSGVQGGAEMGAYATAFPGGRSVDADRAAELGEAWGFDVPSSPGRTTPEMLEAAGRGEIDVLVSVGGNFREVLPGPAGVDAGIASIPLRVHVDIVPSAQMFTDPADTVLLLPATTRYEMPGGVTETSTERRIIFSPEVPGPRIPEARPEGEILAEIAARARPDVADAVRFGSTADIRAEIARVVPMYAGIEALREKGDMVQYGGRHLCAGWVFPTDTGRARFDGSPLPELERDTEARDPAWLRVVTRRGKQFNSLVHEDRDPMNRATRDAVLVSAHDARRLDLAEGVAVVLENEHGAMPGVLRIAPMAPGAVQVHWPEANVLLDPLERSPDATIPAYKGGGAQLRAAASGEVADLRAALPKV